MSLSQLLSKMMFKQFEELDAGFIEPCISLSNMNRKNYNITLFRHKIVKIVLQPFEKLISAFVGWVVCFTYNSKYLFVLV